jgi:hypothetical protein
MSKMSDDDSIVLLPSRPVMAAAVPRTGGKKENRVPDTVTGV